MKLRFTPGHLSIALAFVAGLITACNLTSTASSSSSLSGVHVQLFHVTGTARDFTANAVNLPGSQPQATITVSGSAIGTVASWLVSDNNGGFTPVSESAATYAQAGSTANSSLATFKMSDGTMQPQFPLYYTSSDCSLGPNETPFAGGNWVGYNSTTQGQAFRDQVGNDGVATSYWYLKPGTLLTTVNIGSVKQPPNGACTASSLPGLQVYPTVQNTQALSGYNNAPAGALGVQ